MIRKTLIVVFSLVVYTSIHAQTKNHYPRYGFGVSGGMNYSGISVFPSVQEDFKQGSQFGLMFHYLGGYNAGIKTELNYITRGWTENHDTLGTYERTLQYLELPILSHFIWGKGLVKYNIDFGPNISYEVGYSEKDGWNTQVDSLKNYYVGKATDRNIDYGFMFGAGLIFDTKAGNFELQARYNQGLNHIFFKRPRGEYRRFQNQTISVSLVYFFDWEIQRVRVYKHMEEEKKR